MTPPKTWRNAAACLDEDPALFYPLGDTGPWLLQIEEARNICRTCPVIESCFETAMALEGGANLMESIQDALIAGTAACAEIHRMRAALARLRDTHRPKPHADPTQPGALCATCSLDGALTAWPCQPWTAADRILTHGQP